MRANTVPSIASTHPAARRRQQATLSAGTLLAATLITAALTSSVPASELIYTPINPSFGGNPFNSSHLLGLADRQNVHTEDPNANSGTSSLSSFEPEEETLAERFARDLQRRLLSGLASEVTEAIFGENPQDAGTVVFGDQTINFTRGLESISIEILDNVEGTSTLIEVPVLVVEQ